MLLRNLLQRYRETVMPLKRGVAEEAICLKGTVAMTAAKLPPPTLTRE